MPRRIDVELTSRREDGTWTWRAAGARQPKGELDGSLLYDGAAVGDVVKAEADFDIEGITVTGVTPPKGARKEPERIEITGAPVRDDQLVTSTLVGKGGGRGGRDRGDRGDRGDRPDRGDRRGPRSSRSNRGGPRTESGRPDGDRRPRRDGEGSASPRRDRPARPPRPVPEARPKAKRLRPGRVHRNEVLASLPEEHRPIAEAVLRGGIPAVRQAVDKQNEEAKASGAPEIKADGMVSIGEQLLPALRTAEWHDRADAALADVDELDLRDLRSVVVAADVAARDEVTRELAQTLREALSRRVEQEHAAWLAEVAETLADGRTVRALRLSSRPPKAGSPLPPELAAKLTEATNAALTAETGPDRFATVLDALAYSPVRQAVVPQGVPAEPGDALLTAVRKMATRLPQIAALFGIEASSAKPPRSRGPRSSARSGARPVPAPPDLTAATPAAAEAGSAPTETPAAAADATTDAPTEAPGAESTDAPEATPLAAETAPAAEASTNATIAEPAAETPPASAEAAPAADAPNDARTAEAAAPAEAPAVPSPAAVVEPAAPAEAGPAPDAPVATEAPAPVDSPGAETPEAVAEPTEAPAPAAGPTPEPATPAEPVHPTPVEDVATAPDNPDVIEQHQDITDDTAVDPDEPTAPPAAAVSEDVSAAVDNPDVIEQHQTVPDDEQDEH